jgi:hypothetical protein
MKPDALYLGFLKLLIENHNLRGIGHCLSVWHRQNLYFAAGLFMCGFLPVGVSRLFKSVGFYGMISLYIDGRSR